MHSDEHNSGRIHNVDTIVRTKESNTDRMIYVLFKVKVNQHIFNETIVRVMRNHCVDNSLIICMFEHVLDKTRPCPCLVHGFDQ
jgi:hypothetical protein